MTMNNQEKTYVGIITFLTLLLSGAVFLNISQLDDAYYCPLTEEVGVFHRLSASAKTGYYYLEDGTEKGSPCKLSRTYTPWLGLKDYAKSIGVDPMSLIKADEPKDTFRLYAPAPPSEICVAEIFGGCSEV